MATPDCHLRNMGKSKKVPSPCIDICKFRRQGHCIGCSMTKAQKKMFKDLKRPEHKLSFVEMLTHQQASLGRFSHWAPAYKRKCLKKGAVQPIKVIPKTG